MIMGTPIIIEIKDEEARLEVFEQVFDYFRYVDETFSTYKDESEIMHLNNKKIKPGAMSPDMRDVFSIAEETKRITHGYFDIVTPSGMYDPSGVVKGWSILHASKIIKNHGIQNFYVEAGGDIQTSGTNEQNEPWCIGIQNPFNKKREIVKKVYIQDKGIATSGNYVRGAHIYNPKDTTDPLDEIVSTTVIGPDILEADRYATAAFAMGRNGIYFIENLDGFEGYAIDKNGIATMTTNFMKYTDKTHA